MRKKNKIEIINKEKQVVNFESKYLIRLGIPGWIIMYFVAMDLAIYYPDEFSKLIEVNLPKILGLAVLVIAIGIPLGQLVYQIYFATNWAMHFSKKKDQENYFKYENYWHKLLSKQSETMIEYLSGRYSHLLGRVHELGALTTSLLLSGVIQFFYKFIIEKESNLIDVSLFLTLILFGISFGNYRYFQSNFHSFRIFFIKELAKDIEK